MHVLMKFDSKFIFEEMHVVLMSLSTLPSPALEIVEMLAHEDSLSAKEIGKRLGGKFDSKSIKYALRRLLENRIIYRIPNLMDMRSVFYRVAIEEEYPMFMEHLGEELTDIILAKIA